METTVLPRPETDGPSARLSIWSRAAAMFVRPAAAWSGLERRGQWWFPLAVSILVSLVGMTVVYERAFIPTALEQVQRQMDAGQTPPEAAAKAEEMMTNPVMKSVQIVTQSVIAPAIGVLLMALLVWLVAGFMLGHRFRFRDAFVVAAWAGLVAIPAQLVTFVLAWVNESMQHLHIGFGVLLPVEDAPSRLMTGLGMFLDYGIGPLHLWYVVVLALGAAALSGAPRRSVLVTLGVVWGILWIVFGGLAALFSPAA
jgi:hypothetical protein